MSDSYCKIEIDNVPQIMTQLDAKVRMTLEAWGRLGEGFAVDKCPVDTGALRNSITSKVDEKKRIVAIGTNNEYAAYVEFGTGVYSEKGGRRTPWGKWKGKDGEWHAGTRGQRPQPYIRPAVADHADMYKDVAQDILGR